jgi:SdrD B-like domain
MSRISGLARILGVVGLVAVAVGSLIVATPKPAAAAANLVLDKRVSTTSPAPGESFTYSIRFRCASTFENCTGATIVDNLPAGPDVQSYAVAGGLVTGATKVGNIITWSLKEPLAAGSTGLVTVVMAYPTCAAIGFDPAPISNSAVFSATGSGSVSATAPAVDGQPVPTCPPVVPTPPATDVRKTAASLQAGVGGYTYWTIGFPSKPADYTVEDVLPAGAIVTGIAGLFTTEVDCGAGWDAISSYYLGAANVDCPISGSGNALMFPTITKIRFTVPANSPATTVYLSVKIDNTVAPGTQIQNCVTPNYAGAVESCGTILTAAGPGSLVDAKKYVAGTPTSAYTNPYADYAPNPPAGMPQGPADYVFQLTASKLATSGDSFVDPVIADLLPAGFEFVPDADGGTNWWSSYTKASSGTPATEDPGNNPPCVNPSFEKIDNFAGTGRTMLRWTWLGCTLESPANSVRVGVYVSIRLKPTVSAGTSLSNHFTALSATSVVDDAGCLNYDRPTDPGSGLTAPQIDVLDMDGDGNNSETTCPSNPQALTIPVISTVDSSKWVKGALDTAYSRYPASGDTDLAGDGEYDLYLTNQGNTPVTSVELVDILPHVGDTSVTAPATARGSQWGAELVSMDSIEHAPYGSDAYTAVPAGELVTGYSTSKNPCRWDTADPNEANRLKPSGGTFAPIGSVTAPAGCEPANWSATQVGARSFAVRYTPVVPLQPGASIKIHVTVGVAPGEAPAAPMTGKIAWNSFGFSAATSAAAPNNFLLSTEPIQVGIKMVDPSVTATIGDYVWLDSNHDGIQNEPTGISGVQVGLYRPGFGPDGIVGNADDAARLDSTITDANGAYSFWGLIPNTPTYQVRLDRPADFSTGPLAGLDLTVANTANDATDSDAVLVGSVPTIASSPTLAAGTNTPTYDFGFFAPASLGDHVWEELGERNGAQESNEPAVVGATVRLYDAGTNTLLATTTTDVIGHYRFDNLTAGSFYVVFDLSTATSSGVAGSHNNPLLYEYTTPNATGDEVNDSDPDSTGRTSVITLVTGQHDPRWDAGIAPVPLPPANPASLGDYTWIDSNNDGVQDADEPPLSGVTVTLLDSQGFAIRSTTTDALGRYEFVNLFPDSYYTLLFTPPPGYKLTQADASVGATDATDSDAHAVSGYTFLIPPIGDNNHDPKWDAGFIPTFSLGNLVWVDTNNDGLLTLSDATEQGIDGIRVKLFAVDGTTEILVGPDGRLGSADDAAGGVLTNAQGLYLFTNLEAGDYIVDVTPPSGLTSSTGNGVVGSNPATHEGALTPDQDLVAIDSDDNGSLDTATGTVRSKPVTLSAAAEPTAEGATTGWPDATPDNNSNVQVDFGFYSLLVSLGDVVWIDSNRDGLQDVGEPGLDAVTVELLDAGGVLIAGRTTTTATVSGRAGSYSFTDLAPGSYQVRFTLPSGYRWTTANVGADDSDDSDVTFTTDTAATATTTTIVLTATGPTDSNGNPLWLTNPTIDVGVYRVYAIGDYVWEDTDGDGIQNDSAPLGAVSVRLFKADGSTVATDVNGMAVAATSTDPAGHYVFDNLLAGQYVVGFTKPTSTQFTILGSGTTAADSNADRSTGKSAIITLDATNTNLRATVPADGTTRASFIDATIDAGIFTPVSVGNYVWFDDDRDGRQDQPVAAGVNGVTATLYAADGTTPVTVDASGGAIGPKQTANDGSGNPGYYLFSNLLPGQYVVKFTTLPTGFTATVTGVDSSATDSNGLTATSSILTSGTSDLSLDLGIFAPVSVGNYVWEDSDADGRQNEPGSAGLNGVTVTLFAANGTTPVTTDANGGPIVPKQTVNDGSGNPGYYLFSNLLPGQYVVKFTTPVGMIPTSSQVGDTSGDSDGLTATSAILGPNETDLTLESGFYRPASIGDFVWFDENRNGQQDTTESGVSQVAVELLNRDGIVISATTTDTNGKYLFDNLRPGTYTVRVIEPADKAFSTPTLGAPTTDSNVDHTSGKSAPVTVNSGDQITELDAGLIPVGSLDGFVWVDSNKNGVRDPGETALANVVVRVVDTNGATVATVTTDADGSFKVDKIPTGTYSVIQSQPDRYASTTPNTVTVTVVTNQTAHSQFGEVAGGLPVTGATIGRLLAIAALLVTMGVLAQIINRRREHQRA